MAIEALTLVFLFIGIKRLRSKWTLPFLFYIVFSTVCTLALMVATTIAIVNPESFFGKYLKVGKSVTEKKWYFRNTWTLRSMKISKRAFKLRRMSTHISVSSVPTRFETNHFSGSNCGGFPRHSHLDRSDIKCLVRLGHLPLLPLSERLRRASTTSFFGLVQCWSLVCLLISIRSSFLIRVRKDIVICQIKSFY